MYQVLFVLIVKKIENMEFNLKCSRCGNDFTNDKIQKLCYDCLRQEFIIQQRRMGITPKGTVKIDREMIEEIEKNYIKERLKEH